MTDGERAGRITASVPVLPCGDLDRSAAFYARLGYEVTGRYPDYLILSCRGLELHLARMTVEPDRNRSGLYLRVEGIDGLAGAFGAVPEDRPWGQREFSVSDPDGNLLRFGEPAATGDKARSADR